MTRALRVLVFDDDAGIRNLLTEVVRGAGHEVYVYENPKACPFSRRIECACHSGERCADAIICDLQMPLQRGLDFLDIQRGKGCRIEHLMMMSGDWTEEDRSRARGLGCQAIQKPFRLQEVLSWLRKIAEEPRQDIALADWFRLAQVPMSADRTAS